MPDQQNSSATNPIENKAIENKAIENKAIENNPIADYLSELLMVENPDDNATDWDSMLAQAVQPFAEPAAEKATEKTPARFEQIAREFSLLPLHSAEQIRVNGIAGQCQQQALAHLSLVQQLPVSRLKSTVLNQGLNFQQLARKLAGDFIPDCALDCALQAERMKEVVV